ncbi:MULTISPECIES: DNA polymerase III subunit gamma/tau [Bifidobacterium]|uniref:DNA polymerase III subunit gamma/tau n=1 Tax=Bifidobacterium TaxID=1678 RepID=UPI001BDC614E|nr:MULTISPECIES: DNA polymerase III subunit gamma/tau [Bifidobacterium]MBT1161947.1 DNA polymerase III subunit gamma/tau [Bifidobacterium sp. SO1]MBW3079780.1 DNA polymerase III subunit gamma/tau [Bifidobacterium simiiventris]
MALALYRRYRPDTFDGVIGQDQVTIPLMRALDAGKLTHAYLFSGPRGCGKTSSARILARCINCAKGPTSHPCGECDSCRDLATGGPGSIDVVEIDAASHNGVDDARELRERAGFAPARDRYKIFILDEAHMVTQQGFNALLKIVEEPPEHVMFIFATTEPDKVIGTIRSRTHHYPFRLVPQEIMGPYLETICEKESIKPEPGVLKLAMRAGGGSVRDTLSVLDQLMVGSVGGVISHDSAVALLGFTPEALIGEAVDAVIDRDGEALYGVIQKVVVGGFDPRRFVEDLLARVRDLLVLLLAGERAETVMSDTAEGESMADLQRQANALGLGALTVMADTINATLGSMTGAISPRMRLELLAARLLAGREGALMGAGSNSEVGGALAPSAEGAVAYSATGGASTGFAGAKRNQPQTGFAGAARNQQPTGFAGAARNVESSSNGHSDSSALSGVPSPSQPSADSPLNRGGQEGGGFSTVVEPSPRNASGVSLTDQPNRGGRGSSEAGGASAPSVEGAVSRRLTGGGDTPQPQDTSTPQAPDTRTPDQKWDALVAALPEGVQRYVNRTRIPKILLAADQSHPDRQRLWLKFDKSLSKYAFALAVADEAVDGTTNVVAIVRAEVHKLFGESVTIAPTNKMADGSVAPPFSKLPQDQQQKVKAQLLQESLQAAVAKTASESATTSTESGDRENSDAGSADASAKTDDDEVHRAGSSASVADDDPWNVPDSGKLDDNADPWTTQSGVSQIDGSQSAAADDDPWAQPDGTVHPLHAADAHDTARHPQTEPHKKHVAVPDPTDDTDPWAVPAQPAAATASEAGGDLAPSTEETISHGLTGGMHAPSIQSTGAAPASAADPWNQPMPAAPASTSVPSAPLTQSAASVQQVPADPWDQSIPLPDVAPPDDDPWSSAPSAPQPMPSFARQHESQPNQNQPVSHFNMHPNGAAAGVAAGVAMPLAAGADLWNASANANAPSVAESAAPQVDPDDDEYSMDDESLGSVTAMSVDELKQFFEVKKVEEFKADDPKNPRNIARNKHEE